MWPFVMKKCQFVEKSVYYCKKQKITNIFAPDFAFSAECYSKR